MKPAQAIFRVWLSSMSWALCMCAVAAVAAQTPVELERYALEHAAMGVKFGFVVYAPSEACANKAFELAAQKLRQLDNVFSDYQSGSEARRLVESDPGVPVEVSPELFELMRQSRQLNEDSERAFDITIGPLSHLWRLARKRNRLPDESAIAKVLPAVGQGGYELVEPSSVIILRPGMRLDFGGIAKGYAADECLRIFRALGMASALVDASGDIALGAPPPGTRGWVVAVAELNDPDKVGRSLLLSECGVATSSDARQALVLNGVRYSHIIDPRTGWALTTHCSVTVVAKTAALADGWASALSVLGGERGTRLADQRGDIQALVVSQPNAHASPQEFTTRGFSDCLTQ